MLETNEYFNGKVKSIAFQTEKLPATVGVMDTGQYKFSTEKHETITVVSGKLMVQLPGNDSWQDYASGSSFEVAANQKFQLQVEQQTAYLCTYA